MNIDQVIKAYKQVYYLENEEFLPVVIATVLANSLKGSPVWLMLIGGSSSGKSEVISAICKYPTVKEISTLTSNTFLSGMPSRDGRPTSLLHQIGLRGTITMKDFTSVLSLRKEALGEIMAQFREIFDGHLDKFTGMGKPLHWEGQLNIVAGVTEKIFYVGDQFSDMGTRFIHYILPEQDRIKTTQRATEIDSTIDQKRKALQEIFNAYMVETSEKIKTYGPITLPDETRKKIIEVADFAAIARSPIGKDYKGGANFVFSPEMPMRLNNQLQQIAKCFIVMGYTNFDKILFKIGLDCMPKGRRMIMKELAGHKAVTIKGLSYKTRFNYDVLGQWMEELYLLRLVDIDRGITGDTRWVATPRTRSFMEQYENIVCSDTELTENSEMTEEQIKQKSMDEFGGF
jgi:hypothetical protein